MKTVNNNIEHLEYSFEGYGKTKLYCQSWKNRSENSRAILLIVHGLKDHSARYSELVDAIILRGFDIHAFDLRGHGRSTGKRAYVNKFDDLVSDLEIFVKMLQEKNPDLPLFVFGHSMGGTTVALSSIKNKVKFDGIILSAVALKPGESISRFLIFITRLLGSLFPHLPLMNLPNQNFSRDPKVIDAMSADPLIYQKNGPVRTAAQLLNGMQQIQMQMEQFSTPVLILHGTADKLTNPEGSQTLSDRASSRDKTIKLYPGLVHDLVHEPEKAQVIDDILSWLEKRAPDSSVMD
jgi:acylglycerol lipase